MRPPARPADARELLRHELVARRELHAERGQHAVEALVLERQVLGVAFDPVDGDSLLLGPPAGGREQLRGEVDADDLSPGGGGPERDVAGAGGDVEHLLPRLEVGAGEKVAPRPLVDQLGDGGVVSGRPGGAVHALAISYSGHVRQHPPGGRLAHRAPSLSAPYLPAVARAACAAASARLRTPSLERMRLTWWPTVFSLMNRAWAIRAFDMPSAISSSTSCSRAVRSP